MPWFVRTACALSLMLPLGGLAAADKAANTDVKPVDYQGNLAKVPASDPPAGTPPTVLKALAGQHPRLLFTRAELAELQQSAAKDPLIRRAIDDTIATAGMFPLPKGRPDFVLQDTPAIWKAGGTYTGLAYAVHLSPDPAIRQKVVDLLTMMLEEPYWADTAELDSNMGTGNNMLMVGTLFDAVHDDLEPGLRARLAAKILVHVRRMWYLGHQQQAIGVHKYWQQDPQNNHRWHRNAGMAACLLAIADEPGIECAWMLEQFKGEMDFIHRWLPVDGDCHEGATYQQFGFMYLALASRMMDRVLGTTYQRDSKGLRNAWAQQLYWWAPGRGGFMSFGDDDNGKGGGFDRLDPAFFIGPHLSRDPLAQAALTFRMQTLQAMKEGQKLPWTMLVFYDPTVPAGDAGLLPKHRLMVDLGAASMRDAWKPDAVALTFKCGPYGGYRLNEFAHRNGAPTYINVAHDDPDANSFALAMAGDLVFHPGTYSMPKRTETISTILVDGKGQVNEGQHYTQPVKDVDMRTLSYLTAWKPGEAGRVVVEGEAAGAYGDRLTRFRRTAVWLPGDYILILDHVVGSGKRSITWLGVGGKARFADPATGSGSLTGFEGREVGFQVVADVPLLRGVQPVKMQGRRGDIDLDQIRCTAEAESVRLAAVLDPWKRGATVEVEAAGDTAAVRVRCGVTTDTWTWKPAVDARTPSTLEGRRGDGVLIRLGAGDGVPQEP